MIEISWPHRCLALAIQKAAEEPAAPAPMIAIEAAVGAEVGGLVGDEPEFDPLPVADGGGGGSGEPWTR